MKAQLRRLAKVKATLRARGLVGNQVPVDEIVWKAGHKRLPAGTRLKRGQRVVCDHRPTDNGQGSRLIDRITDDPVDTGHLLDEAGRPVGTVIPDPRPGVFVFETNDKG